MDIKQECNVAIIIMATILKRSWFYIAYVVYMVLYGFAYHTLA